MTNCLIEVFLWAFTYVFPWKQTSLQCLHVQLFKFYPRFCIFLGSPWWNSHLVPLYWSESLVNPTSNVLCLLTDDIGSLLKHKLQWTVFIFYPSESILLHSAFIGEPISNLFGILWLQLLIVNAIGHSILCVFFFFPFSEWYFPIKIICYCSLMPLLSNLELQLFCEITFIILLQVINFKKNCATLQELFFNCYALFSNFFILFTSYVCSYYRNGNHAVDDSMEFKCASSLEALCWQEYFKNRFVFSIEGFG